MKRNIVVFLFITIVLCGNFASCKKYPLKLVAEDRMVNILTELYLLEGVYSLPDYARRMTAEDEKAAYRKEIFERYGVSESRFDSTMEYCVKNPDMGLEELGKLLSPPLGKSGVNHRLKKIEDIAKNI